MELPLLSEILEISIGERGGRPTPLFPRRLRLGLPPERGESLS